MIVNKGELYDILMNIPNFIKTDKYEKYFEIFVKICEHYDTALELDDIILYSHILEIIYLLSKDSRKLFRREGIKSSNYEIIEKVISFIKENLTSDLSLETMASYAGFSPIYFHNCFKASTGKTLREDVYKRQVQCLCR